MLTQMVAIRSVDLIACFNLSAQLMSYAPTGLVGALWDFYRSSIALLKSVDHSLSVRLNPPYK